MWKKERKRRAMLLHPLLLSLLHLMELVGEASSASLALPDCPDTCGSVAIPYPFGIRDGCYREDGENNQSFFIRCDDSFGPPQAYLGGSNIIVLEASLEKLVITSRSAYLCYNGNGYISSQSYTWTNLFPPYTFSQVQNRFIVVGCNIRAVITDRSAFTNSCRTYCGSRKEGMRNGSCDGIGCCQIPIPKGLNRFYTPIPTMETSNPTQTWSFAPCGYAFLADKDHFNFSVTDLLDPYFFYKKRYSSPVAVDWAVGNKTCEEARNNTNFACGGNATCINSANGPGYRCRCRPGYDGNPYLLHGCQEMDKCAGQGNPCGGGFICKNTAGNYSCYCPLGMYDNGTICIESIDKKSFPTIKVALGVGLSLFLGVVSSSLLYWVIKQRRLIKLREKFFKQNGGLLLQQRISQHQGEAYMSKIFTAKELEKATNNYEKSRILGKGGSGTVYRGNLPDNNRVVAIKKSITVDDTQIEQFINEVFILSRIMHRNVVKLLGCCLETEVPLLVYEYVTNGTLSYHLRGKSHTLLSWDSRLRIASETAAALAYLHSATSIPIIHRDVKSANILLDDTFTAKVSDFGASRLVPIDKGYLTTLVIGTSGYLDPDYSRTNQLTEKSDVYSFGVVLAELLTGRKPILLESSGEERVLANYFVLSMEQNRLCDILDMHIVNKMCQENLSAVSELAKRCLSDKGEERPTMREVAAELEGFRRSECKGNGELGG